MHVDDEFGTRGAPHSGVGAASSWREDRNNSSICGLKSARVAALARLGGAEDAFERCGSGSGADGKAEAGNAVGAELFEGLVGVGFRVAAFIADVVWKTIRKDDKQPIRGAGLGFENVACTTDAGAEARVARWLKLIEPGSADGAETLPERLDRREMDGMSAVGPERIDRDAVAELFERGGQCGGRPPLVVMNGKAVRIGVGGGSGGIDRMRTPRSRASLRRSR